MQRITTIIYYYSNILGLHKHHNLACCSRVMNILSADVMSPTEILCLLSTYLPAPRPVKHSALLPRILIPHDLLIRVV
jgi:hypothetical protein